MMRRGWNQSKLAACVLAMTACSALLAPNVRAQEEQPQPPFGNKFPLPEEPPEPAAPTSGLAVRAAMGTPGADPVGGLPVTVQFVSRGSLIDQMESQLDEHGVLMIEDELPTGAPFQPLVYVKYDGVSYMGVGPQMGPGGQQQAVVEVTCYAVTEEEPAWRIQMHHVLLGQGPDIERQDGTVASVGVSEVIVIESEGDRTWIGRTEEGVAGHRTTAFPLPEGAAQEHVQLGAGFNGWKETTFREGWLVNQLPLMPGRSEFRFQYLVPADDGRATLALRSPAPVQQFMMIAPTELVAQADPRLQSMGERRMGEQVLSQYIMSGLEAGAAVDVTLDGLALTAEAEGGAEDKAGSPAKMVAIVGAGVIFVFGVIFVAGRLKQSGAS